VHHFEHLRDNLIQNLCLFADNFVCNLVRQRQDALQPIQEGRWHLVVLVLFPQELDDQELPLLLTPLESTNLKCDFGNTEGSLCEGVQLKGVNVLLVPKREN